MRPGFIFKPYLFILISSLVIQVCKAQEEQTEEEDEPLIKHIPLVDNQAPPDSAYVTVLPNLWSIRILALAKNQGNSIRNSQSGETVKYRPTNRLSLGLGFTYKFLLVDLGINLKLDKQNATERFDFHGLIITRKYLIDLFLQVYQGYELAKAQGFENPFRDDLAISNLGVNFMRTFGGARLSIKSAFIGSEIQKKAIGAFIAGGFFSNFHLRADSSIIPPARVSDFNDYANLDQIDILNFGVSGGYAYSLVFPKNWFFFLAALPGIGLNFGDLHAEKWYKPPVGPFIKIHARAALGRSSIKNYQIVSFSSDYFFIDFGHGNFYLYNFGKLKFVYGFRLENKKSPLKKVL